MEGGVCLAPWALGVPHDRVVGSSSRGFPELSGQSFCLNPLGQTAGNILSFSSVSAFFLPSLPPLPPLLWSLRERNKFSSSVAIAFTLHLLCQKGGAGPLPDLSLQPLLPLPSLHCLLQCPIHPLLGAHMNASLGCPGVL